MKAQTSTPVVYTILNLSRSQSNICQEKRVASAVLILII